MRTGASEFRALVLREAGEGKVESRVETLSEAALPAGDVTVAVEHSILNYKDGMVLQGLGRLVRRYPHVPGVDFAGAVERSESLRFKPGDKVVLTGWRVGELHWGGYAQKARVNSGWLVGLPEGLTTERAMAVGTAGFTALLAIMALERQGLRPGEGEVLVTGAAVAAVGNAGGVELRTTVIPFLLRGVNLLGIDSVVSPREEREEASRRIARELPMEKLDAMTGRARLEDLPELGKRILQGGVRGRVVVDVDA